MNQPNNSISLLKNKRFRNVIIILTILISLMLVFIIFRENQYQKKIETAIQYEEEKNNLRDNLDDLIDEHELLKDEYGDLSNQLEKGTLLFWLMQMKSNNYFVQKENCLEPRSKLKDLKT